MAYSDGANVNKWEFIDFDFEPYFGGIDPLSDRLDDPETGQELGYWYPQPNVIWLAGQSYPATQTASAIIAPNDPAIFSTGETGPFPYIVTFYGPATGTGEYYTFEGYEDSGVGDRFASWKTAFFIGGDALSYLDGTYYAIDETVEGYRQHEREYVHFFGAPDARETGKRQYLGSLHRASSTVRAIRHTDGQRRPVIGVVKSSFEGVQPPRAIGTVVLPSIVSSIRATIKFFPNVFGEHEPPISVVRPNLTYEVVNAQTYRTEDFWEYTDWFAEGYDPLSPPVVTYRNVADRNRHENPNPTNWFVKLIDNGAGYWTWTAYDGDKWTVVAQQQGTIQISDKFFKNDTVYGWDANTEDYDFNGAKVRNREGSFDLRVMADALLDNKVINDLEQNELWFSMINFVHAHHDQVDWAFKTSFMTLVGFNEALLGSPIVKPDNTDFILSYVEEVKPYHVTVRDFARSYAPKNEIANVDATDFDKPGYFDADNNVYRRLDETVPSDRDIMESGPWQHWLANMDLARRFHIQMKIDRIWPETGNMVPNAADRIMSFYQPNAGMQAKDLDTLLKLDFKGTILDGMTFETRDPAIKVTKGGTVSAITDINGEIGDKKGFQMRDPRVAEDTPEDMVRLGAHDVILFQAHDKWGAGAPRSSIKTYDVSRLTETHTDLPIGQVARNVLVFADGMRQIENVNYVVDYLSNNVHVPLLRESGSRVETIVVHSFSHAAHTTIIDQTYHISASDLEPTQVDVPERVLKYAGAEGEYYVEVTNNGRYVASSLITTSEGAKKVSFKGIKDNHFVITYYKGSDHATTSMKEVKMPTRTNPNGDNLIINENFLLASAAYEKANFTVDFDNRLVFAPSRIVSGGAGLSVKNFDTNQLAYTYTGNYQFDAPVQGTSSIITHDASLIGEGTDQRVRYRAVQIRDLTTFDIKLAIGTNGIYEGEAKMTGTTPSTTRIPENAKIMTLRNSLAANQAILIAIPGQLRVYDLSGNLLKEINKDIGWSANSFLVKMQQTAGQVEAMLINPDSVSQPVKLITFGDDNSFDLVDYVMNGFSLTGGGGITAAAYDTMQNQLIIWFYRNLGGEAVAAYSMTSETFRWTTWSGRADLDAASQVDRFHNPRRMNLSRINRGLHLAWVSDKGSHGIDLRTGAYTSLNATPNYRAGENQFWDEKTGTLVASSKQNDEGINRMVINYPDSSFSATFDLGSILLDDMPHVKPYNSSMMVEKNGLRLAPPRIYYVVKTTEKNMGEDKVDVADLRIIDDTGMTSGVVLVADNAYESVDEVRAANRAERFLYWRDFIVFRDADAENRQYVVAIAGSGDFNIDDTTKVLTVNSMTNSDTIRTIHWRNDGVMLPQTWSFKANASGTYRINTKARKGQSWVTINGRRLVEGVDYEITPAQDGAWDAEAFENFRWDFATDVDIAIKNMLKGHENDLIVITTFEGPQITVATDWQHTSLTPDIVRFKHNNDPEEGARPLLKEPAAWATETHDPIREGGRTTAEVTTGTASFNIAINALSVPAPMLAPDAVTVPDASQNVPGVIWLGAERIEYFKREKKANGIITLDQVRRGTKGTPKQTHPAGSIARVEHPFKVPAAPRGDILPVPSPSIADTPYRPYSPPQFEGWYLKVRFYMPIRGRDYFWYAYNYYYNSYQPNPPYGARPDWQMTGSGTREAGSPNSPECFTDNLCGQSLVELVKTGHVPDGSHPKHQNYEQYDPNETFMYNPYDFTYQFNYDIPPAQHGIQLQYGAGNWGDVGAYNGSPLIIEYKWWNAENWVRAVTAEIGGLWPYYFVFDVLPPNLDGTVVTGEIDRDSTKNAIDEFFEFMRYDKSNGNKW
jgi:hypothetical protein